MAVKISIGIKQNSQDVTNNTSNVTANVTATWTYGSYNKLNKSGWLTIDGTKYDFTSPFNTGQSTSGSTTLFTKTVNVKHASDGTKTLSCSASYTSGVSSGTVTASASKVLTTIPRASTMAVKSGTIALGTAMTLLVTRKSTSFTHTITYTCGSASGTICTKSISESISFTPPLSLASQNTTGTSVTLKYTLTTYNGSTSVGSKTYSQTVSIPASVKPTCSISVSDPTGYKNTYGGYIQGLSKFQVTITGTPSYSSPIASYSTTANGSTYTSSSFTTDIIKNSGTMTINGTVKDKRGRIGTGSATATVLAYSTPKITNLSVGRCKADGSDDINGAYVKIKYSCSISSLNTQNKLTSVVKYKKSKDSTYTSQTDISASSTDSYTDRSIIIDAETGSSYNIEVAVTDNFGTISRATSVSSAFAFMHFKGTDSMGLGKIAELDGGLDIGFKTRFANGLVFPVLNPETDLDTVLTPNFYAGENVSTYNYGNCPLTSGTFYLEVVAMGGEGQVRQTIVTCNKTVGVTLERIYYQGTWGEWKPAASAPLASNSSGGDLNNYINNGTYYFYSDHTPANAPSGVVNGTLVVMATSTTTLKQLWFRTGTVNTNDHQTYVRTCNGGNWSNWHKFAMEGVVLFEGSATNPVFSDRVKNYSFLEIYFSDNNNVGCGYVKISAPAEDQIIHLSLIEPTGDDGLTTYIRRTSYKIALSSSTASKLMAQKMGYVKISSSSVTTLNGTNYIRITKVIGYR